MVTIKPITKTVFIHPLNVAKIEKQLEEQAKNGQLLIEYKCSKLTFISTTPKIRKYFVYMSPLIDKHDSFLSEFYLMKRLYGARKSKLNKTEGSIVTIAEIDSSKVDDNYKCFAISRNAYYQKYYFKMLALSLAMNALPIALSFLEQRALWLFLLSISAFLYCGAMIILLKKQKNYLLG